MRSVYVRESVMISVTGAEKIENEASSGSYQLVYAVVMGVILGAWQ